MTTTSVVCPSASSTQTQKVVSWILLIVKELMLESASVKVVLVLACSWPRMGDHELSSILAATKHLL